MPALVFTAYNTGELFVAIRTTVHPDRLNFCPVFLKLRSEECVVPTIGVTIDIMVLCKVYACMHALGCISLFYSSIHVQIYMECI